MSGHPLRIWAALAAAALVSVLVVSTATAAVDAAGGLDPSFGHDGRVVTNVRGYGGAVAIAVQPDGRILAAGNVTRGHRGLIAVVRYLPDGSRDSSFGATGTVVTHLIRRVSVRCMTLQSDGKIVVAGSREHRGGSTVGVVVRYRANGTLDKGFGTNGVAVASAGAQVDPAAVVVDAAGRILLAGTSVNSRQTTHAALWALNGDGSADRSFGRSGKAQLRPVSYASDLALDTAGRIIVGGTVFGHFRARLMAARFDANGTLDRTFGSRGYGTVGFRGAESSSSLSLQSDGAIVVGGYGDDRRDDLAYVLTRFEMDGTVDRSFGHGGRVVTSFRHEAILFDTVVQPDGRIVAGGSSPKGFGIVRYLPDGSRDPSFGNDGRVETRTGSGVTSVALQADGKLLAAGFSAHEAFLVVRYLTS